MMVSNAADPLSRLLPVIFLLIGITACAAGTDGTSAALAPEPGERQAVLTVENESTFTVSVYLLQGDSETRLGMISALQQATFKLSAAILGGASTRLLARPMHSRGPSTDLVSEAVTITSEQDLRWKILGSPGVSTGPRRAVLYIW